MKHFLLLILALILSGSVYAQNNSISYKAVIKDNLGNVVANQSVTTQFSILEGAAQTLKYKEVHTATTDTNGILILNIGEGTQINGTYNSITWESDDHFLKVEINTGSGLVDLGTTQFMAVPYAKFAENSLSEINNLKDGKAVGRSVYLGSESGNADDGGENQNTAVGDSALRDNINGVQNVAIGESALLENTSGSRNTTIGQSSMRSNKTGIYNTALGEEALYFNETGNQNVAIGRDAGESILGSGNIVIGYQAGKNETGSNKLYIENSSSSSPLIYGEFDNNLLRINGVLDINNAYELPTTDGTVNQVLQTDGAGTITWQTPELSSGLEALDEGNGIGYRLLGKDPENYADIGLHAIDFTNNTSPSTIFGATGNHSLARGSISLASGNYSSAIGFNTISRGDYSMSRGRSQANGDYSTAIGFLTNAEENYSVALGNQVTAHSKHEIVFGAFSLDYSPNNPSSWHENDRLFNIGNGISASNQSNAFTILKNGTITAPSFDLAEITDDRALITKEYADTNLGSSGLEAIDEGNGIGWRLKGSNQDNYTDVGLSAVDLSTSTVLSSENGAGGNRSTALGINTVASGGTSTALGSSTVASGAVSTAMGNGTVASGSQSTAMGNFTSATQASSTAMGNATSATGVISTAMGSGSNASGYESTAMGSFTNASGTYSTSIGRQTDADSYASLATGQFNIGGGTPGSWMPDDPIFEIGNGSGISSTSNAFTVLKNGKVGIGNHQPTGYLEVKAANSGEQPNINLIHEGATGASINFSNTDTTNDNVWTLYGDTNTTRSNSIFNLYHSVTGNILQIKGDGDVGINGTPNTQLHLYHGTSGANDGLKLENVGPNTNWWRMYVVNSNANLNLYSKSQGSTPVGNFNDVTGTYSATSDRRLKKDFKPLKFSWNNFMTLETLSYLYKAQTDTKRSLGLIAQDVKTIYPELVSYNNEDDVYHLNYSGFGVVAIKAVQELKDEVDTLKKENAILKQQLSKLEALEARLTSLENNNSTSSKTTKK